MPLEIFETTFKMETVEKAQRPQHVLVRTSNKLGDWDSGVGYVIRRYTPYSHLESYRISIYSLKNAQRYVTI